MHLPDLVPVRVDLASRLLRLAEPDAHERLHASRKRAAVKEEREELLVFQALDQRILGGRELAGRRLAP